MIQLDESRDTRAAKGAGLKLRCVVLRRFESCSLHQMSKRIDIEAYTQIFEADDGITDEQLVAFGLSAIVELKRCYNELDIHGIGISFDPKHNEEDEEILTKWLEATTNGYYGSVYEYKYDITASE